MKIETAKIFWIVWNPASIQPPSYRHATLESAQAEAHRLAFSQTGQEFIVLQAVEARQSVEMQKTIYEEESPF